MLRTVLGIAVATAIVAAYGIGRFRADSQAGSGSGRHILYYVDPMHPSYKSDRPGIAPDCGMRLIPVFAGDRTDAGPAWSPGQSAPGTVRIDGATQRLWGIQLASVERSGATQVLRVVGRVVPEDTRLYRVNSGVDGFIRETHQDSVGAAVRKDQKLATYYAPDFLAQASGFLAAVERVPGSGGNDGARTVPQPGALSKQGVGGIQAYTDRLRNLGMSDLQIKRVADSRQLPASIDVVAPADGFILARNVSAGQHFEHGMEFYRIADLSQVWVAAEVSEQDAPYLHPRGLAYITLRDQARHYNARIADSLPESETGGGTVRIRLEVDNPEFLLRPEMLVDVELPIHLPDAITVPLDALVDSGAHARIYVEREESVFEPREVQIGWRFGERVQILKGAQPGERVVSAATFLVDSESRLHEPAASAPAVSPAAKVAAMPGHLAANSAAARETSHR